MTSKTSLHHFTWFKTGLKPGWYWLARVNEAAPIIFKYKQYILWCPNNIWCSVKYICVSIHMHYFFYFIGTASASKLLRRQFLMYFMRQERQNRSKSDTKTIDSISAVKLCSHMILILRNAMLKTEAVPPLTYGRTSIDKHVSLYFVLCE